MTAPAALQSLSETLAQQSDFQTLSAEHQAWLTKAALCSPWLWEWLDGRSDWQALLEAASAAVDPGAELAAKAASWSLDDDTQVMSDLRQWRNWHLARLIIRDANGLGDVQETARTVSDLADTAIEQALGYAHRFWAAQWGEPGPSEFGEPHQGLVVLAMGKHGARELNLSSDIDLIFTYPSAGETANGRSHEEFFTRVGRKLIRLLDTRTPDGIVFRVDMRLRPWGQSGALVSNFTAMHNYYSQQGREWERFAMVKARPLTGAAKARKALEADLNGFVYRRYVDFHALGALRKLKSMIQKEVRRQQLESNIKLGQGGIREVEFIAQAFQLIRGGQDYALQTRGTWPILSILEQQGYLPGTVVRELADAYGFLRDLEHRIQALRDEQTQRLPGDETDLSRLAWSMGCDDTEDLLNRLDAHRERVHYHFQQVIAEDEGREQRVDDDLARFWADPDTVPSSLSETVADEIRAFRSEPTVQRLTGQARDNLDRLMPLLLTELARIGRLEGGFSSIRPILEAVLRRTVYFVLLAENPEALKQLCRLVPVSPWIATQLQQKPYLLDELTDPDSLYRLPNRVELMDDLHLALMRVPEDDLEQQMEVLRHFRHGRVMRAAACEVTNMLPLMKISDYLVRVGEVVVEQALALAWQQMVARHGRPSRDDGDWCELDFGVIAYGKMGGLELSYESDLDLVFLHNASLQGETQGPKVIDNVVFMARLGQRLIHLLTTQTPSGILYEVDSRLRPSGNSGQLVTRLSSFEKYQTRDAWTWEHQALVRARYIAGDADLQQAFNEVRRSVLQTPRDPNTLRDEVVQMRQKMVEHLSSEATASSGDSAVFNVKHDPGGIVDLEFLVQYLVLAHAEQQPEVSRWSDNVRCIKALHTAGILDEAERDAWLDAYITLREQVHHALLAGTSSTVPLAELTEEVQRVRSYIQEQWQHWLGVASPAAG